MASDNYIEETIGGENVQFRKLTPWDRRDILKKLKRQQRESLLQDLRDVQADKGEMLAELRAHDEKDIEEFDFLKHFDTPEGKVDVFEAAMSEMADEQRQRVRAAMSLSSGDTVTLAARLCNITLAARPVEGDDPNRVSPAPAETESDSYNRPETTTGTTT